MCQCFVYVFLQESIKTTLATSVWQISRQNLRFLTVLGEGNFGKVNNNCDIISLRNSKICGTLCTMYYISKKKSFFSRFGRQKLKIFVVMMGQFWLQSKRQKIKLQTKKNQVKICLHFCLHRYLFTFV